MYLNTNMPGTEKASFMMNDANGSPARLEGSLLLQVINGDEQLFLQFSDAHGRYNLHMLQNVLENYKYLLQQITIDQGATISGISFIRPEERENIINFSHLSLKSAFTGTILSPVSCNLTGQHRILFLNEQLELVPVGMTGNMYLIPDGPQADDNSAETYFDRENICFTGHTGRWNENGQPETDKCFGDAIRSEIRDTLLRHPFIRDAILVARPHIPSGETATAYYSLKPKNHQEHPETATPVSSGEGNHSDDFFALLKELNDTDEPIDVSLPVIRRFEEIAATCKDRTALKCNDLHFSYQFLNNAADNFAVGLSRKIPIQREDLVAIVLERSAELVISILAVWKLGAAYIPVDPSYPEERIAGILDAAKPRAIIAETGISWQTSPLLHSYAARIVVTGELGTATGVPTPVTLSGDDLAYVIFTSGSTGVPKGVMIEQKGMLNHILSKVGEMNITDHGIVAQNASQCFDISIWQMFSPLIAGGKLVIYDEHIVNEPEIFIQHVHRDEITVLEIVPTYLTAMLDIIETWPQSPLFSRMEILIANAETLKPNLAARWFSRFPAIPLVNTYGATEVSDDTSHYIMHSMPDTATIPVCHRPIPNFRVYILDDNYRHCREEEEGQIYLSGPFVGRGYLNDAEKTAAVFVHDPFREPGSTIKMYKTGDYGKFLPDGRMEFIGRKDQQVKINGQRVELGEVEHALTSLPPVKDAVVLDVIHPETTSYLHAFVIPYHKDEQDLHTITAMLTGKLPYYMIPAQISFLEEYPLNQNGKVDRKILREKYIPPSTKDMADMLKQYLQQQLPSHPLPDFFVQLEALPQDENGHIITSLLPLPPTDIKHTAVQDLPQSPVEKILAEIWREVLNKETVLLSDNFFETGGHSLKALKLVSRINKTLHVKMGLGTVFMHPTIRQMAAFIANGNNSRYQKIPLLPPRPYYETSRSQKRLFLSATGSHNDISYNMQYVFRFRTQLDAAAMSKSLLYLIERHEILRTVFIHQNGDIMQQIHSSSECGFELTIINVVPDNKAEPEIINIITADRNRPFDLENGPLLRATLIQCNNEQSVLLLSLHHIIGDGWSAEIIFTEISALYASFVAGKPASLKPLPIQYKEYASWHNELITSKEVAGQLAYWRNQLQNTASQQLQFDYYSPGGTASGSRAAYLQFNAAQLSAINHLCRETKVNIFPFLQSIVNFLIYLHFDKKDILLGIPTSGRNHIETEGLIGFCLNPVILRNTVTEDLSFATWLTTINQTFIGALDNQDYPFDILAAELRQQQSDNGHLFNVWLDYHDLSGLTGNEENENVPETEDVATESLNGGKYPLDFIYDKNGPEMGLTLWYNTSLFSEETAQKLLLSHEFVLSTVCSDPAISLATLRKNTMEHITATQQEKKNRFMEERLERLLRIQQKQQPS
ncbi:amino acid adenylation domain-containing protein [Chitinophaga oryzae]|uniref:Amino acid adenylation domain-containing protein n=1 Tax=Chitinophaga oryzae TaxID=2725414 RepID=A0ABX6LGS3_9BACT|nr:non-ribosomal peptide synthetase [Chitinophaga oryzae]QJB39311.1 amino acid adenylation domain-containing protein [Chitinophaga oryzae]